MIRHARWAFALALLPIAACSNSTPAPMATAAPMAMPALAAPDMAFVNAAAASDATEIGSSNLAAQKARSARVKSFAAKMVSDHTAVSQQLMTIAQSKGVTPDATMTPMQNDMMAKLNADKPAMFDRDFLHGQFVAHQAAIKTYKDEISMGQDPDLKAFAQQTLPKLEGHLKMVRALGGR